MRLFAWDGFSIEMPSGWEPAGVEQKPGEILARFEDERAAERLQVKLQEISGKFSVERNMKGIEKGIRRARKSSKDLEFSTSVTIPLVKKTFRGRQFATFGWTEKGLAAWGVLLHCEKCARAAMLQVVSGRDEDDPETAGRILSSFRDHPDGDLNEWSAYGVEFSVPREWSYAEHVYDPRGLFRVTLKKGRERLSVLRWRIANLLLKGLSLEGFARRSFGGDFAKYGLAVAETKRGPHPAIAMSYDMSRWTSRARAMLRRRLSALGPRFLCGILWRCDATNCVYSANLLSGSPGDIVRLNELASTLRCCPAGKGRA